MKKPDCLLGGPLNEPGLLDELKSLKSWEKVDMLGFVTREEVKKIFAKSVAGMVTFLPFLTISKLSQTNCLNI